MYKLFHIIWFRQNVAVCVKNIYKTHKYEEKLSLFEYRLPNSLFSFTIITSLCI